jgi:hypothetical protein
MAGQIQLDTKYYPSDFNVTTVMLPTSNSGGVSLQHFALMFADRNIIIDSVQIRLSQAIGANVSLKVVQISNTAIPATSSVPSAQTDVTDAVSLTTGGTYPNSTTFALTKTSGSPNNNIVPAGSTVWLYGSAAWTANGSQTIPHTVQIRWRSQF